MVFILLCKSSILFEDVHMAQVKHNRTTQSHFFIFACCYDILLECVEFLKPINQCRA